MMYMRGECANEKIHDVLTWRKSVTLSHRGLLQADVPLLSEQDGDWKMDGGDYKHDDVHAASFGNSTSAQHFSQ